MVREFVQPGSKIVASGHLTGKELVQIVRGSAQETQTTTAAIAALNASAGIAITGGVGSIPGVTSVTFSGATVTGSSPNATVDFPLTFQDVDDDVVTGVSTITFAGATVSGTTPNATVTISGGGGGLPTRLAPLLGEVGDLISGTATDDQILLVAPPEGQGGFSGVEIESYVGDGGEGSADGPQIAMGAFGGVQGAPTATLNGTLLGSVWAYGYGTTDFAESAAITFTAAENFSDGNTASRIALRTKSLGGGATLNRLVIDENGAVVAGTPSGPAAGPGDVNIEGQFKVNGIPISGGGLLSSGVISLSSAQLLDLANTPIEIVAAPGADEAIVPVQAISTLNFGTTAYPGITNSIRLLYGSETDVSYEIKLAPFVNINDDDCFVANNLLGGQWIGYRKSIAAGEALNLFCSGYGDGPATGPIVTTTLANGGSGYAPGDTGQISAGNTDAQYTVNTVDGGGAVVTYTISTPGTGYVVANDIATATLSGGGDGLFTINITAVQTGDGTGTIEVFYRLVTWP